jgi:catechol 2,3-dioxygenase-like lactoylglutathione lyase family enzyme
LLDPAKFSVIIKREERFHNWHVVSEQGAIYSMNFNPLIPELSVSHFEKSLSFYTEVLKFRVEFQRPEHPLAFLSYQGCQLMIAQENPVWKTGKLEYPYGRGIHLAMLVDTLDVLLHSLQEHHYPLFAQPAEEWYRQGQILLGRREFLVMDPDGYLLRFAQSLGQRPL